MHLPLKVLKVHKGLAGSAEPQLLALAEPLAEARTLRRPRADRIRSAAGGLAWALPGKERKKRLYREMFGTRDARHAVAKRKREISFRIFIPTY